MLSKNQARIFFLVGTILFSGVFFYMSYDTIANHKDKQTNAQNITAEVIEGKHLFDNYNCMGCHTIMGEGAYYAPELTKVYDRRGPEWIKIFLDDPQAMFPGERKMTDYNFTDKEKEHLIAFFKWIGEMDLNGFPAEPDKANFVASNSASDNNLERDLPAKWALCIACHSVGGSGGQVGPALDGVGSKFDEVFLAKWISDPQTIKKDSKMPKLPLTSVEQNEIVEYLTTLK